MVQGNHYHTLGVTQTASVEEIKHAYRRLVKLHHPDTTQGDNEQIRRINAAYSILKYSESRQAYDRQLTSTVTLPPQRTVSDEATDQEIWLKQVYSPLSRILVQMLNSLKPQLNALAADPYDEQLLEAFEEYILSSKDQLLKAQQVFRKAPNPGSFAGVASRLYYALNHLEDALDELRYFSLNLDDRHLHVGQELFGRAKYLRTEASQVLREIHRI
jgi:molecular chaperone DnaJ